MTDRKAIDILLIDDHIMFADGLQSILNSNDNIGTLKSVTSAEEGYQLIAQEPIDLVITDIGLPKMNGIELIKKVKARNITVPFLVLSMHIGRELVKEILYAEAEGYLLKKAGKVELLNAVDRIVNGGTYYGSEISSIMMDLINDKKPNKLKTRAELTSREREILQLICRELSSKQIASELNIGVCTVETHRRSMFQKTNSKSVIGLIRYAVENNLAMWD
ncbi:response regulator transcription factor [Maribacter sp. 2-571]|uniref:response regulator transcription factor n=1 Tax=Maribacter sp. 2-571 TaxID=3417569 RepID=UPI003D33796E